ncbi:MAG: ribosome biogenesis GTPase YlqF [Bacilli bacterium]|nr:ribosome biogenesis GTPase YlqF [Bacilli bacterium]
MGKDIHWFPGHMKKALIQIQDRVKLVDCVIELLDARSPLSSRNEYLFRVTEGKDRLVVLTKSDLADSNLTSLWVNYFSNLGYTVINVDLNNQKDVKRLVDVASKCGTKKREKEARRGMKPQPIRAMIVGIPNVGKSTLINKIAKRSAASVANTPGHTKTQQWIKVSNQFELLDTPGILPSNYENKEHAVNLALIGSINENILPNEDLANKVVDYLRANHQDEFVKKYDLTLSDNNQEVLKQIGVRRGLLTKGEVDMPKVEVLLLNEFKKGLICRFTLEKPE